MITIARQIVSFSVRIARWGLTLQQETCWIEEHHDVNDASDHQTLSAPSRDVNVTNQIRSYDLNIGRNSAGGTT
jgi:hypothetical protein